MRNVIRPILLFASLSIMARAGDRHATPAGAVGTIRTVAGNGERDAQGFGAFNGEAGVATGISLNTPTDVIVDPVGNLIFSDTYNHRVRKVTPDGRLTTVAGSGKAGMNEGGGFSGDGGPATEAELKWPEGLALDRKGSLYIADSGNMRVRRVDPRGMITTFAGGGERSGDFRQRFFNLGDGGPATEAVMDLPYAVAAGERGDVYIADTGDMRIRKVAPDGTISTVAGVGPQIGADEYGHLTGRGGYSGDGGAATDADMGGPHGLATDGKGNLYFADRHNACIRKIDAKGVITTVAGTGERGTAQVEDGPAVETRLYDPTDVAVDRDGSLYIADFNDHRIYKVDAKGKLTTVAGGEGAGYSGDGGPAREAELDMPSGLALDGKGNLYFADSGNHRIRAVRLGSHLVKHPAKGD